MGRIVIVSNRVPLPSNRAQAGGLAVVLGDLMAQRGGLWFGWDGTVTTDAADRAVRVTHAGGTDYATVALGREEYDRYYNGFSNGVLWPLLHTMPELIRFERRDAAAYHDLNRRWARDLVPLLHASDLIWVHDYHLLPMAAALRCAGVRNAIGFFLHIPFPACDVLAAAPGMAALIRDMLEADLIGFQTENDLANFADAAEALAGASRVHGDMLQVGARCVRLGVHPVEIDSREVARMAKDLSFDTAMTQLRCSLGYQKLIFGAERLDPTKGLVQRLAGYRRLLESRPEWRRKVTFLQIAATSRKEVDAYRSLRAALDQKAGALNADLGEPDWMPLRLVSRGVDRAIVAAYMRQARIGLVTPLRDGMNLVAKEYVAAQDPADPGVLVLSRFAGAARQLRSALLVNPRDPDEIAAAIAGGLAMPLDERRQRWEQLWAAIEGRTPLGWGAAFIDALMLARTPPMRDRLARRRSRIEASEVVSDPMPRVPVAYPVEPRGLEPLH